MAVENGVELPTEMSSEIVSEFLSATLSSIPRSDQRRWGEHYARALLAVQGKKTMRALAQKVGAGAEQSLYQFISKSPWDAAAVRQALGQQFHEAAQPRAWVVEPLVLTKVGDHSVGVERQFVPQIGRVVNCQQSMGIWLASDRMSCPVDWRLALPECWTEEPGMRKRASIPEHVGACPPEQCATGSIARMKDEWGLPVRPVVMDLRETAPYPVCAELIDMKVPFVVRVDPFTAHTALEPRWGGPHAPQGVGDRAQDGSAELLTAVSRHCMPVEWLDHATGTVRATTVGTTRVRLPRPPGRTELQDLVLLAAWANPGERRPSEYWLSNLSQPRLGTVYRTAMLSRRVQRDLVEVGDRVGLRDFEGRSFRGWHHHMTMVSLAHALTVLGGGHAEGPAVSGPSSASSAPRSRGPLPEDMPVRRRPAGAAAVDRQTGSTPSVPRPAKVSAA
ncbi:transposase [Streptomyces sp. T-3]|nr:transposase [Streptomyces sp. T-3]